MRHGHLFQLVLLAACAGPRTSTPPTTSKASTPLFEFHIGFWVNLHQRLYAESGARPPIDSLHLETAADQALWQQALDAYRKHFPERGFLSLLEDPELISLNRDLSALGDAPDLSESGFREDLRPSLEAAAEVYRRNGWPRDEAEDHALLARLEPQVAQWGAALTAALSKAYETPWPRDPIRVDLAAFAGPVGAYTVLEPTHITLAASEPKRVSDAALEILFHEASHALVTRVEQSIARAAKAKGVAPSPTLWHEVLFFSTGEVVRRLLGPGYMPYAYRYGLYQRSPDWAAAEPLLARVWPAYLDGHLSLDAAIDQIVAGAQ